MAESWNYRLTVETIEDEDERFWSVRELYYDAAGEVTLWSVEPIAPTGGSPEEFGQHLARLAQAANRPAYDLTARTWLVRSDQVRPQAFPQ